MGDVSCANRSDLLCFQSDHRRCMTVESYKLDFVSASNPEDKVFEQNGVKLVVDPKSFLFVKGACAITARSYADTQMVR